MRQFTCASLFCLLALGSTVAASAKTIHWQPSSGPIQAAVQLANSGDSIHLEEGRYVELAGVTIDKPGIEIAGEDGAIIDGIVPPADSTDSRAGIGLTEFALKTTIRGVTIQNFGAGIHVQSGSGDRIQANTFTSCVNGVFCTGTQRSTIDHNTVRGTLSDGIVLDFCSNVTVTHNTANYNGGGITLQNATTACRIAENDTNYNSGDGILVDVISTSNVLTHNSGFGNGNFDAEDQTGATAATVLNAWSHNKFGRTSPPGL